MYLHIFAGKMKLEEAIKQPKFNSEFHKLGVNILYTSSWLSLQRQALFKKHNMSAQQFNILRILRGQYPNAATVNLLIERMIDKNSNASRIVEKLRTKNLVERHTCEKDRRRVDVRITEKGLNVVGLISEEMKENELLAGNLTQSEAKLMNTLLDKLRSKP